MLVLFRCRLRLGVATTLPHQGRWRLLLCHAVRLHASTSNKHCVCVHTHTSLRCRYFALALVVLQSKLYVCTCFSGEMGCHYLRKSKGVCNTDDYLNDCNTFKSILEVCRTHRRCQQVFHARCFTAAYPVPFHTVHWRYYWLSGQLPVRGEQSKRDVAASDRRILRWRQSLFPLQPQQRKSHDLVHHCSTCGFACVYSLININIWRARTNITIDSLTARLVCADAFVCE